MILKHRKCRLLSRVTYGSALAALLLALSIPGTALATETTVNIQTRVQAGGPQVKTLTLPAVVQSLALEVQQVGTAGVTRTVHAVTSGTVEPLSATVTAGVVYTFTIKAYSTTDGTGSVSYEGFVTTITTGGTVILKIPLGPPDAVAGNPTVVSTIPVNGSTNVSFTEVISATFSESMSAASLTESTVTLQGGGTTHEIDVFYTDIKIPVRDEDPIPAHTVAIIPDDDLQVGVTYTVTLTTSVKDAAGHPLATNFTFGFTTVGFKADGTVKTHQKISATKSTFGLFNNLDTSDEFGSSVANIGDLNHDGIPDLAIGAQQDDDGTTDTGAVWIMFLNTDGKVKAFQKISDTAGSFAGTVLTGDRFGSSLANLGRLKGDETTALAVGAQGSDEGGTDRGAVWILFLNTDGTVNSFTKITQGTTLNFDQFGHSVTNVGDVDGDGTPDLAVGADGDDDGGVNRGAVYILFMKTDGTVRSTTKISDTVGNFTPALANGDNFGSSVAGIGDLDGDDIPDLAVGARHDSVAGSNRGAVYILFLNADGTVKASTKISDTTGNLSASNAGGALLDFNHFGSALSALETGGRGHLDGDDFHDEAGGDLDGDGIHDLVVGADQGSSSSNKDVVWILFLNKDGTVKSSQRIASGEGGFTGNLANADRFGSALTGMGDLNRDGVEDLAVGSMLDDDGSTDHGAVWILLLK